MLLVLIVVEFRESVIMGETSLSPQEVRQIVVAMGKSYKGNNYHLLQMNCNHFASDLCKQLVGRRAPSWVCELFVRVYSCRVLVLGGCVIGQIVLKFDCTSCCC